MDRTELHGAIPGSEGKGCHASEPMEKRRTRCKCAPSLWFGMRREMSDKRRPTILRYHLCGVTPNG